MTGEETAIGGRRVRTKTAGNIQLLLLVSDDIGKLKYAHDNISM